MHVNLIGFTLILLVSTQLFGMSDLKHAIILGMKLVDDFVRQSELDCEPLALLIGQGFNRMWGFLLKEKSLGSRFVAHVLFRTLLLCVFGLSHFHILKEIQSGSLIIFGTFFSRPFF
jgi:hypothetical protein